MKWHRPIPYSTLFKFLLFHSIGGGGGGMGPSALSYASDSGAAKICQQGTKARAEGAKQPSGEGGFRLRR